MLIRCCLGLGLAVLLLAMPPSAYAGSSLKDDLAALEGTWVSTPVAGADGQGTGTIKLNFAGATSGALSGRGTLQIATKRGGSTTSSERTFTFKLVQNGADRLIVAPGPGGTGLSLTYRLEGGQLLLTGRVASRRVAYQLTNVALKHPAEKK